MWKNGGKSEILWMRKYGVYIGQRIFLNKEHSLFWKKWIWLHIDDKRECRICTGSGRRMSGHITKWIYELYWRTWIIRNDIGERSFWNRENRICTCILRWNPGRERENNNQWPIQKDGWDHGRKSAKKDPEKRRFKGIWRIL